MELLESNDPQKISLINKVNQKKNELEEEASALSKRTDKLLLNALVIGGTLALTFFIVRNLSKGRSKKEKQEEIETNESTNASKENQSSVISEIGSRLAEGAVLFLLGLAKDKLSEYLNSREKGNEHTR